MCGAEVVSFIANELAGISTPHWFPGYEIYFSWAALKLYFIATVAGFPTPIFSGRFDPTGDVSLGYTAPR